MIYVVNTGAYLLLSVPKVFTNAAFNRSVALVSNNPSVGSLAAQLSVRSIVNAVALAVVRAVPRIIAAAFLR